MKNFLRSGIAVLFLLLLVIPISAIRGVPGSPDFGYGAWLHPHGSQVETASQVAGDLKLDWVALPLDWATAMPQHDSAPDMVALDAAMHSLKARQVAVMISLTNPPAWARSEAGINPFYTAQWLAWLSNRYPSTLQAVELFPAANTLHGWGATPNPQQYAAFFQQVQAALKEKGSRIYLVAAGLQPSGVNSNPVDWNDLEFLQQLYAAGAKEWMPLLSLQMPLLSGDPVRPPSAADRHALRHYEQVRQVMLDNGHTNGILWITLINPPNGTIKADDQHLLNGVEQAEWQKQALIQMRSQLYMGVVFIQNLNPPSSENPLFAQTSLITSQQTFHPFYSVLQALIQQTNPHAGMDRPGRPKSAPIPKCLNKK